MNEGCGAYNAHAAGCRKERAIGPQGRRPAGVLWRQRRRSAGAKGCGSVGVVCGAVSPPDVGSEQSQAAWRRRPAGAAAGPMRAAARQQHAPAATAVSEAR